MRPAVAAALLASALMTSTASADDPMSPQGQFNNGQIFNERMRYDYPEVAAAVAAASVKRHAERLAIHVQDPERQPDPNGGCPANFGCTGDPRLDAWDAGRGISAPVLFTARDGATLSGHVWATRTGAATRPGIVIINGSIVGYDRGYWWAAQALAKDGYVVMTFDTQGEGESDQFGEAPDQGESLIAGTPPFGDGGPFYDGGTDALDFFLSTPTHPYMPRPSRTSGTSHAAKQKRRVEAGLDSAYNPFWNMLDRSRIGLTGHSFGAYASSYLAQADPRVDAEVAWDTLCVPKNSTRTEQQALSDPDPNGPTTFFGQPMGDTSTSLPGDECMGAPPGYKPDVPIRVPALGITGDYTVDTYYYTSPPVYDYKARVSEAYSNAGVDSGVVVIRGGGHMEYGYFPPPVAASLRGIDLATWYTAAWFDRYLKRDPTAASRLMTGRWRDDARSQVVDPAKDPNMFSQFFRSRMDIHTLRGRRAACADLRKGCSSLVPASQDCGPKDFGYLIVDRARESRRNPLLARCRATR